MKKPSLYKDQIYEDKLKEGRIFIILMKVDFKSDLTVVGVEYSMSQQSVKHTELVLVRTSMSLRAFRKHNINK